MMRKRFFPYRTPIAARDEAFTLIELMTVILVISILVGIAIPVYLSVRNKAKTTTAKNNFKVGCCTCNTVFLELLGRGENWYRDPSVPHANNWAWSISYKETKIKWVRVLGSNTCLRAKAVYQGGVRIENLNNPEFYNWDHVYGRICVYRGYLDAGDSWVESNASDGWRYLTIITLNQANDYAHFTCHDLEKPIKTGTFHWANGTGDTTDFDY